MAATVPAPAAPQERRRSLRLSFSNLSFASLDGWLLALGLCAVPVSIAVCEIFLGGALVTRLANLRGLRRRRSDRMPRVLWFWLAWVALEVAAWLRSPELRAGLGEMRHLLLIAAVLFTLPAIRSAHRQVMVWRGIVIAATASSLFLIGRFGVRLFLFPSNADPVVYLRGGGLLNHWMIYSVVEILVFAAMLELWHYYPRDRRWLGPALAINGVAIVLSMTRSLWLCCLLLLAAQLAWNRSRWLWAVPAIPCVLFLAAPSAIRSRVTESLDPSYYSNAERVQMLRVGWKMVREHPWTGVGPGRVEKLYPSYLAPGEPIPAYHGHLHNNAAELAAEFGWPVLLAAALFVLVLFRDLMRGSRRAVSRHHQFLCRTGVLGLTGFAAAGMFDYTYGHSLGLILLVYAVAPALRGAADRSQLARAPG